MHLEIEQVFFSELDVHSYNNDKENESTDVIVVLKNHQRYIASFISLQQLGKILSRYKETGENLSGKYLWAKNMILIDHCEPTSINTVITELIEEGVFKEVFLRIA